MVWLNATNLELLHARVGGHPAEVLAAGGDFVGLAPESPLDAGPSTIDVAYKNDRVVAINSAIEVDLSGQVCSVSIGHRIYSGIGGQMDFIRGAALSNEGKAIIAIPSTTSNGKISRIVTELKAGVGVVTTRGHVHWVVTEYGAVNLHGKTLRERAEALISIAHPDFKAELKHQISGLRYFVMPWRW